MIRFILFLIVLTFPSYLCAEDNVLLPLGNSITYGAFDGGTNFCYRDTLQTSLGVGVYDFRGANNMPASDPTFDVANDGVNGDRVDQMRLRLETSLITYLDNITGDDSWILIMGGTNDVGQNMVGNEQVFRLAIINMERILYLVDHHNKNINVVVALITPFGDDPATEYLVYKYNKLLYEALRKYRKENLHIVDMYSAFTANPDYVSAYLPTVHPNTAGCTIMSNVFYAGMTENKRTFLDLDGSIGAPLTGSSGAALSTIR